MGIKEILEKSLGVPKKHRPERAVKSYIASNFYIDGNLFIEAFDIVNATDSMENRAFRAKAIVNLCMSIECSLKSLIISLSKDSETPKGAYKKARSCGHKIEDLHTEMALRAKKRFSTPKRDEEVFNDLQKLKVESRYSFEVWLLRIQADKTKFFAGEDLISSTIDNKEWASRVRKEAVTINNLAKECHSKYMAKHAILSGKKFETFNKELNNFLSSL
jgi:hypothetical protein